MTKAKKVAKHVIDRPMLIITGVLLLAGIFVFISAALSVLPKNSALFQRMVVSQLLFALVGGVGAAFLFARIPFRVWQQYALPIGIVSTLATLLVFVPGLGFEHGGARRWISLGVTTLQPAELLKFGVIMYWAAFLSFAGKKIRSWGFGLVSLLAFAVIPGVVLLLQPDTGTFLVLLGTLGVLYFLAGAPLKHIWAMAGIALLGFIILIASRPYLLDRIKTFSDPTHDPTGSSYQIQQSLIAVGSGGLAGRGYGRSAQKFQYLPEPVGDSVFAVAAEELGFIGSIIIIFIFMLFLWRGLHISARAPNQFARLLVAGIIIMITLQAFVNIASILGLMPLTGLPLSFMSHGGTSLLITLAMVGIVLQVSRYQRVNRYAGKRASGIMTNSKE